MIEQLNDKKIGRVVCICGAGSMCAKVAPTVIYNSPSLPLFLDLLCYKYDELNKM
jgi:hypothetical protein